MALLQLFGIPWLEQRLYIPGHVKGMRLMTFRLKLLQVMGVHNAIWRCTLPQLMCLISGDYRLLHCNSLFLCAPKYLNFNKDGDKPWRDNNELIFVLISYLTLKHRCQCLIFSIRPIWWCHRLECKSKALNMTCQSI